MEVPPIQSTPAMLVQSAADQQAMAATITQFNDLLKTETNSLVSQKLEGQFPAQMVDTQSSFSVMLDNPTAYGAPNASCFNADEVRCLWVDEWNPGQKLQNLVGGYVAFIVGLYL